MIRKPTDRSNVHQVIEDVEKRCEDLEVYIRINKDVIDKQMQQIVRKLGLVPHMLRSKTGNIASRVKHPAWPSTQNE